MDRLIDEIATGVMFDKALVIAVNIALILALVQYIILPLGREILLDEDGGASELLSKQTHVFADDRSD